jgi:hypothetical protein
MREQPLPSDSETRPAGDPEAKALEAPRFEREPASPPPRPEDDPNAGEAVAPSFEREPASPPLVAPDSTEMTA